MVSPLPPPLSPGYLQPYLGLRVGRIVCSYKKSAGMFCPNVPFTGFRSVSLPGDQEPGPSEGGRFMAKNILYVEKNPHFPPPKKYRKK